MRSEPAVLNDEVRDLLDALAAFQIRKDKGPVHAHSQRVGFHDFETGANQRSQIDLVDHEKVRSRNSRTAFARYFFALRNVDDINSQVRQLRTERSREIISARFD